METFWGVITGGDRNTLISSLLNTYKRVSRTIIADEYKKAGGGVKDKDGAKKEDKSFGDYLKENTIKIEKMDPLESLVFKIKGQFSYTDYDKIKQILAKAGYDVLRCSSSIAYLKSILSDIIRHRLGFAINEEKKAIYLDFQKFFAQLNYWIEKEEYSMKNIDERVSVDKLSVVFRTDGTPSSNKKKPFLVFGFSVIYKNEELAFTSEKIKFFPCVISFAEETNEDFEYWADKVKEAFEQSQISSSSISFSMDGGGFFKWVQSKNKTPYCNCTGWDQWNNCICDFFYFCKSKPNLPLLDKNFEECKISRLLKEETSKDSEGVFDDDVEILDDVVPLEVQDDAAATPGLANNPSIFLFDDNNQAINFFLTTLLDKCGKVNGLDSCDEIKGEEIDSSEDNELIDDFTKSSSHDNDNNVDNSNIRQQVINKLLKLEESDTTDAAIEILSMLPMLTKEEIMKEEQEFQEKEVSKLLNIDFTGTSGWTVSDVKNILSNIHFYCKLTKKADIQKFAIETVEKLKNGVRNTSFGNVDMYWLSKFVICIMHGDFRLANRIIMYLFQETKGNSFYFPRFGLCLEACKIHFNIYKTTSGNHKVKPLCGHDTDRLFKFINQIIDYCLPIEEFCLDVNMETLRAYISERKELEELKKKYSESLNSLSEGTLRELIHLYMVQTSRHKKAIRVKELFKQARDRYLTLRNGYCKYLLKNFQNIFC